jgi:hypothetical protein
VAAAAAAAAREVRSLWAARDGNLCAGRGHLSGEPVLACKGGREGGRRVSGRVGDRGSEREARAACRKQRGDRDPLRRPAAKLASARTAPGESRPRPAAPAPGPLLSPAPRTLPSPAPALQAVTAR